MKTSIIITIMAVITSCVQNDYLKMSKGSGVKESVLKENCRSITCTYDKLKDRVQASASDMNTLFALNGNESRTIQYTWVSNTKSIFIDLYYVTLYENHLNFNEAEVYVGKELIVKVTGNVDRTIGTYNSVAQKYEKVEVLHGKIDIKQAEKIAEADYKTVTIRFYGQNGYKDVELPRSHKLINVVNLAKSA